MKPHDQTKQEGNTSEKPTRRRSYVQGNRTIRTALDIDAPVPLAPTWWQLAAVALAARDWQEMTDGSFSAHPAETVAAADTRLRRALAEAGL